MAASGKDRKEAAFPSTRSHRGSPPCCYNVLSQFQPNSDIPPPPLPPPAHHLFQLLVLAMASSSRSGCSLQSEAPTSGHGSTPSSPTAGIRVRAGEGGVAAAPSALAALVSPVLTARIPCTQRTDSKRAETMAGQHENFTRLPAEPGKCGGAGGR
ncbi:unnamed protein product, partial [Rangifer tarandus platyrhynchus]